MNWNKVLNVFIIIFFILNISIFVGVRYFEMEAYTVTSERKELLEDVLARENIGLMGYVPQYTPRAKLILASQTGQWDDIAKRVFSADNFIVTEDINSMIYSKGMDKLVFAKGNNDDETTSNEGTVSYEGLSEKYKPNKFTEKDIYKVAKKFAKDITLSDNEFTITPMTSNEEGIYRLKLYEMYKNEILFCSYVILDISENGVEKAISRRFKPMNFEGRERDIYPIDEALYAFLDDESINSIGNIHITTIEIGYDLNVDEMLSGDQIEAIPYYKVTLSSGGDYDINAYTLK